MENSQTIPTLCRMCPQNCGIEVTVKNGKPVKISASKDHPFNKGWLCVKGRAALELFYSPKRLKSPLIGKEGDLVPLEWEAAFDFAADRLWRIRDKHGPQALALYHGEGVGHQEIKYYMKLFANVYGTPNFTGVGSICNMARTIADTLTLGAITKPDLPNTNLLIIWGGNPMASHEPVTPREISRLKKRGGQLVVIDPRRTNTAIKADFHLAVKPGSDGVLALNMLHVIMKEGLWDRPFTDKWVHGFETLYEKVCEESFSPERGREMTGLEARPVRQVARAYATTKPASLSMGNGLEHHGNGVATMRLISIMKAVTGNLDIPGGDLFTPKPKLKGMMTPLPEPDIAPIGSDRYPLFCRLRKEGRALSLPRAILEEQPYPVKGMIVVGGNPSLEWPNSGRVRRALEKLEFIMVVDVVASPDSQYADLVLPACTFLERDEHHVDVYHNLHAITLRRQVVEPVYGLPDQMIWVKLAERMGYGEHFPWKSCREGIDYLLRETGVTYDDIVLSGGIHEYEERWYKKYEKQGFNTPTGKVEVLTERLKEFGHAPFSIGEDIFKGVPESDVYPLILTTGGNLLPYLHWQFRYIPRLRKIAQEPLLEIHPDTAAQYGLKDGETAEIETSTGKIRLKVSLTSGIRTDTVQLTEGWEEANANELTGSENADPISGFPNLKSLRCRLRKVRFPILPTK